MLSQDMLSSKTWGKLKVSNIWVAFKRKITCQIKCDFANIYLDKHYTQVSG